MTTDSSKGTTNGTPTDTLLTTLLGGLVAAPPAGLTDSLMDDVFARWVTASSDIGTVCVAFTPAGVQFLRPGADEDQRAEFTRTYRSRFGRPLIAAAKPPAGVLPALRGRPTRTLQLDLSALSAFERAVLTVTRRIPAGQARPYSWVAREAGNAGAVRAVGSVLARNPLPLIIPCHRVVRADGTLGQYLFGSDCKEQLLRFEGANLDEVSDLAQHGVHYLASATTKIVCFPTCRDARRISLRHRHGFSTLSAALAAGYRPCQHCRPAAAA
ncbi:methylated-DNA--[protein]-cysteine S-methyltransferase [Pseudonocardia sp. GCM10023141]|uniref:methylated-DNA--[protein]-cysteine S-methyltransferase n=1 Tax=Pseudonocardia sp. GCM10023141 TaxID=3252653 RepID=UPI00361CFE45